MTNYRIQHLIAALVVILVCGYITWICFTAEPKGAYIFPRLISVVLSVFAIWNLVRAVAGWAKVGETLGGQETLNLIPGLVVSLIVMFFAATYLGFYTCAFITIFALSSIYDPADISNLGAWARRLVVSIASVVVLYVLFSLVLQVQTPTGILI